MTPTIGQHHLGADSTTWRNLCSAAFCADMSVSLLQNRSTPFFINDGSDDDIGGKTISIFAGLAIPEAFEFSL